MAETPISPHVVHVSELYDAELEETAFMVPSAIPRRGIGLLTGPPGIGKSWVAMDLTRAVAHGEGWLDTKRPCAKGKVLYLNFDNPVTTVRDRFHQLAISRESDVYVHTPGLVRRDGKKFTHLKLPKYRKELISLCEDMKPDLIVNDSLRQSHTMSENDDKEMAELMSTWTGIREVTGATVVILHHTAKSQAADGSGWQNARGSGEISASADFIIEVANKGSTLKWTKTRGWHLDEEDRKANISREYLDDRLHIKATSPLPGEGVDEYVDRVVSAMGNAQTDMVSLRRLVKMERTQLMRVVDRARQMGLIRSVAGNGKLITASTTTH